MTSNKTWPLLTAATLMLSAAALSRAEAPSNDSQQPSDAELARLREEAEAAVGRPDEALPALRALAKSGRPWNGYAAWRFVALSRVGAISPTDPDLLDALDRISRDPSDPLAAARALGYLKDVGLDDVAWHQQYLDLMIELDLAALAHPLWEQWNERGMGLVYDGPQPELPQEFEFLPTRTQLVHQLESIAGDLAVKSPGSVYAMFSAAVARGALVNLSEDPRTATSFWAEADERLRNLTPGKREGMAAHLTKMFEKSAPPPGGDFDTIQAWRRHAWADGAQRMLLAHAQTQLLEGRPSLALRSFKDILTHDTTDAVGRQATVGRWAALAALGRFDELRDVAADAAGRYPWGDEHLEATRIVDKLIAGWTAASDGAASSPPLDRTNRETLSLPPAPTYNADVERDALPFPAVTLSRAGSYVVACSPRLLAAYRIDRLDEPLWQRRADALSLLGNSYEHVHGDAFDFRYYARPTAAAVEDGRVFVRWGSQDDRRLRQPSRDAENISGRGKMIEVAVKRRALSDVAAFDLETGRQLWSTVDTVNFSDYLVASDPVAHEGRLYFLAGGSGMDNVGQFYLVCLEASSGEMVWARPVYKGRVFDIPIGRFGDRVQWGVTPLTQLGPFAPPVTVRDGSVYVCGSDGFLLRCDARDGMIEWRHEFRHTSRRRRWWYPGKREMGEGRRQEDHVHWALRHGAAPILYRDLVIAAARQRAGLLAVDRRTGMRAWSNPFAPSDRIIATVGRTLVGRDRDHLAGIDMADGRILWTHGLEGPARPVLHRGTNLYYREGNQFIAISALTGEPVDRMDWPWQQPFENVSLLEDLLVAVSPEPREEFAERERKRLVTDESAMVRFEPGPEGLALRFVEDGVIEAYDMNREGRLVWRRAHQAVSMEVAGPAVLLADARKIEAVEAKTGAFLWRADVEEHSKDRLKPEFHFVGVREVRPLGECILVSAEVDTESHHWRHSEAFLCYDRDSGKLLWFRFRGNAGYGDRALLWPGGRIENISYAGDRILFYQTVRRREENRRRERDEVVIVDGATGEEIAREAVRDSFTEDMVRRNAQPRMEPVQQRSFRYLPYTIERDDHRNDVTFTISKPGRNGYEVRLQADRRHGEPGVTILGDRLYFHALGRSESEIQAIDLSTGRQVASYPTTTLVPLAVHVHDDRLYVIGKGNSGEHGMVGRYYIVEAFDPASRRLLGRADLPVKAGHMPGEWRRGGAALRDFLFHEELLLLSDDRDVHVIDLRRVDGRSEPLLSGTVSYNVGGPIAVNGRIDDWEGVDADRRTAETPAGTAELHIAHDRGHLLIAASYPDEHHRPMIGRGRYGGSGDRMELTLHTDKHAHTRVGDLPRHMKEWRDADYLSAYTWEVGINRYARVSYQRIDPTDPQQTITAIRHDPVAGRTIYECAVPLEDIRNDPEQPLHLDVALWNDNDPISPIARWSWMRLQMHPYTRRQERSAVELAARLPRERAVWILLSELVTPHAVAWPNGRLRMRELLEVHPDGLLPALLMGHLKRVLADRFPWLDVEQIVREEAKVAGVADETIAWYERHAGLLSRRPGFDNGHKTVPFWEELAAAMEDPPAGFTKLSAKSARETLEEKLPGVARTRAGYYLFHALLQRLDPAPDEAATLAAWFMHLAPEHPLIEDVLAELHDRLTGAEADQPANRLAAIASRAGVPRESIYRYFRTRPDSTALQATGWYMVGPFALTEINSHNYGTALPHRLERITLREFYSAPEGMLNWQPALGDRVDFEQLVEGDLLRPSVAYAVTWVKSETQQTVALELHNSNPARLWLNGQPVALPAKRGEEVLVALAEGWNSVLVQMVSIDTGWDARNQPREQSRLYRGPSNPEAWAFDMYLALPTGQDAPSGMSLFDRTPPRIGRVITSEDPTQVRVYFTEAATAESAGTPDHYDIDPAIEIKSVRLSSDGRTATLTTSPLTWEHRYVLSVAGIADENGNAGDDSKPFRLSRFKPGLRVRYYERQVESPQHFAELTADRTFVSQGISLERARQDDFAMMFEGYVEIPRAGQYTFYLASDDGSWLYLDDKPIIENGGHHSLQEKKTELELQADRYPIRIYYFQGSGSSELEFEWSGPGMSKKPVPADALFHSPAAE